MRNQDIGFVGHRFERNTIGQPHEQPSPPPPHRHTGMSSGSNFKMHGNTCLHLHLRLMYLPPKIHAPFVIPVLIDLTGLVPRHIFVASGMHLLVTGGLCKFQHMRWGDEFSGQ